jgi:hypothetical protein
MVAVIVPATDPDSLEWSGERWQMRRDNNGRASNEC